MSRRERKARRLLVGDETYLWSVGHSHKVPTGDGDVACSEYVVLRRHGTRGSLRVVFVPGPGHFVPDGFVESGAVGTAEGYVNLHEPGTVRALLDTVLAQGWDPDDRPATLDGWTVFAAVRSRREAS